MSIQMEGIRQVFPESEGQTHWRAINKTPAQWVTSYDSLCQKCSTVNKSIFLWGVYEIHRPPVLFAGIPFDLESWKKKLTNLADSVSVG
jgi:hypothetical protein